MNNLIVLGAQWGDEGKGKLVDLLFGLRKIAITAVQPFHQIRDGAAGVSNDPSDVGEILRQTIRNK